eukprot:9016429-Pyramimonas_sp.AAC.1
MGKEGACESAIFPDPMPVPLSCHISPASMGLVGQSCELDSVPVRNPLLYQPPLVSTLVTSVLDVCAPHVLYITPCFSEGSTSEVVDGHTSGISNWRKTKLLPL